MCSHVLLLAEISQWFFSDTCHFSWLKLFSFETFRLEEDSNEYWNVIVGCYWPIITMRTWCPYQRIIWNVIYIWGRLLLPYHDVDLGSLSTNNKTIHYQLFSITIHVILTQEIFTSETSLYLEPFSFVLIIVRWDVWGELSANTTLFIGTLLSTAEDIPINF